MPEILAPATASTYKSAVINGANAIYFGYGVFNARAGADNISDFDEVVTFCHAHKVKAYLALNIMIKDFEIPAVTEVIQKASAVDIDAFIISDPALIPIIRKYSNAALHASTQMGIHNREGAKFAERLGFDRIILSREVSEYDILDILNHTKLEIEVFVHGALCTAFSGACLFSAMLTGKSGNRGRCAQLCRREYSCYIDGEKACSGYLLSAKDICLASEYETLKNLGVDSLKIEGRLKSEEYISRVTNSYAELVEGVPYSERMENEFKILFNRGNYTKGYFENNDVIYPYAPNHIGLPAGEIKSIISKNLVLISASIRLYKGDFLKVTRGNEEIGGIEITGETKLIGHDIFYVAFSPCASQPGDKVAITKREYTEQEPFRIPIEVAIKIVANEPIHIIATDGDNRYEFFGDVVPMALTSALSEDDIIRQFHRTGETDYDILIATVITEYAFLTKKQLNDLRRDVLANLEEQRIKAFKDKKQKKEYIEPKEAEYIDGDFIELETIGQLSDFVKARFKNIVYAPRRCSLKLSESFYNAAKTEDNNVFVKFPMVLPAKHVYYASQMMPYFDGVVANNLGAFNMALAAGKKVVAGWALNVANSQNLLLKMANQTVASTELKYSELKNLPGTLVYAFGRLPLMYLNFCPKRLAGLSCDNCKENKITYRDNKGEYPIITRKIENYCEHELRNSEVTNLAGLIKDHPIYLDFTGYKGDEIVRIIKKYFLSDESDISGFNHLRLNNGVE